MIQGQAMVWAILKSAAENWSTHNSSRQGAALAYYSVFSIGPIIVIVVAIAGLFVGAEAVNSQVASTIKNILGETGASAVQAMLRDAGRPSEGLLASALSLGALLFAATGVVIQLKDAFNVVWEVEAKPGNGYWHFVRNYVVSLTAVLALGFLMLVSLMVTTALAGAGKYAAPYMAEWSLHVVSSLVSFFVVALLFAMMFKWLPDVSVEWYDVRLGAILTAALFELGKSAIGFYIGKQGLESTYGAAASIVVVLIWVYYSSQIILMGAEFTRAFAIHRGSIKRRAATVVYPSKEALQ
jgi:membrane protein